MLIEVSKKEYKNIFNSDPHPFISEKFIEINKSKTDKIVRLVEDTPKVSIGLVAGIKNNVLKAPFSSPFGGFHFRNQCIYISEIELFLKNLLVYAGNQKIQKIHLTLPPGIYQGTFYSKVINSLIRQGFKMELPDITNWIELRNFKEKFTYKSSREYYNQAIRNNLIFKHIQNIDEKKNAFELICQNRMRFGRSIYMSFEDIVNVSEFLVVDFFSITNLEGTMLASGILYQFPSKIAFAVFWGDNEIGRPLRSMDFLIFNLINHYKSIGFEYIDLGISTESGEPNEGLLRFKETHESTSSLRFNFTCTMSLLNN
jgi:hypothetical protein